ncbi:unnamed protein product, partial [Mesorhabditis belari]|uniref:Uncharacterized protein n=1 Tax=Mesorhabditis belari TaxID=2138241 RepID=A0AAF3EVB9_9BILA
MKAVKLLLALLFVGLAVGHGHNHDPPGDNDKPDVVNSQEDRDLQVKLLNTKHLFPELSIINQYYALALKPLVIERNLKMPTFQKFIKYFTKNMKTNSSMHKERVAQIEKSLDETFDMLVKQYTGLKADTNLTAIQKFRVNDEPEVTEKKKRGVEDFLLSEAFSKMLLEKTGELLEEQDINETNNIAKRAIKVLETEFAKRNDFEHRMKRSLRQLLGEQIDLMNFKRPLTREKRGNMTHVANATVVTNSKHNIVKRALKRNWPCPICVQKMGDYRV